MRGLTLGDPALLGAAAGFSPLSLSPALWLDASDAATITSSGGKVSQWNDKSGNGRNVTQATSAAQPSTGTNTLNGLNVLTFDGGDYLAHSTASTWNFMHNGTVYFVSFVVRAGTSSDPNALYAVLGTNNVASASRGAVFTYDDRTIVPINNGARVFVTQADTGQFSVLTTDGDIWTANAYTIVSFLVDPSNATASARNGTRVNGGNNIATNARTYPTTTSNASFPLQIGAAGNNSFPIVGDIAEVVIVSGTNATDANRQLVRNYLNTKWAVY